MVYRRQLAEILLNELTEEFKNEPEFKFRNSIFGCIFGNYRKVSYVITINNKYITIRIYYSITNNYLDNIGHDNYELTSPDCFNLLFSTIRNSIDFGNDSKNI